jgi:hypothetical protein
MKIEYIQLLLENAYYENMGVEFSCARDLSFYRHVIDD